MATDGWIGKKGIRYWYYRFRDSEYYSLTLIGVTIIGCIILVFYVILPELSNWFSIRNEVIATRSRIATLQQNITFINTLNKNTLDSQLRTASQALPPTKDFSSMLNAVSSAAADAGVALNDYSFQLGNISAISHQSADVTHKDLSSIQIIVVVNGNITNIDRFIHSLENKLPLSEVTRVDGSGTNVAITIQFYQKPFENVNVTGDSVLTPVSSEKVNLLQTLSKWSSSTGVQEVPASSSSNSAIPLF